MSVVVACRRGTRVNIDGGDISQLCGRMLGVLTSIISAASIYDWLLLIAAVLLLLYVAGTWNYDYFSRRGIPSIRPSMPFMGNTTEVFLGSDNFPDFIRKIVKAGKGHSMIGLFEFQRPIFSIRNPEMMKLVTVKEFDHFMNHRGFITEKGDSLFSKNLFNLKDEKWRDMRATLSPAFTTSKIKGMVPLISKCAEQMVEHLQAKYEECETKDKSLETDMKDLFTRFANDVIASVAFGLQCNSLDDPNNEFYNHGKNLTNFAPIRQIIFFGYMMFPKIMESFKLTFLDPKATSFLDSLVRETVKERKKRDIFRPDMLQLLMQAREGKLKAEKEDQQDSENIGNKKAELTDEDVSAQAIIFFFAGFETVSSALCFTAYQLSHHPEVLRRLQEEVDGVWERSGGKPSYDDVQGMKYMECVVNEVLRMHPPVIGVDRVCQKDITLPAMEATPAVTIRKGNVISIPNIGIHYDEEYWPEPERFDPERFNDENKHNIRPFTYMPFGLGPRLCIGQRFALVEVKMVILHLVRHFNLKPSPKTKHPMKYAKGFNILIEGGFWTLLSPRNP